MGKIKKDNGLPIAYFGKIVGNLLLYCLILFLIAYLINRYMYAFWFVTVMTVSILISIGVGWMIGESYSKLYGHRKITMMVVFDFFVIGIVLVVGYFQITDFIQRTYTGMQKWGMIAMTLSFSSVIIFTLISATYNLLDKYCYNCKMTNMFGFSHDQNEKTTYKHEFTTHDEHEETAKVYERGNPNYSYKIKYKVPKQQEYKGLYENKSYESVYRCQCCGYTRIRKHSSSTKVE